MKKHLTEIIIFAIQLFMFYIFPMFTGPTEVIAMVLIMLAMTLIVSFMLGIMSSCILKYLYPFVIAILFLPTIPIYYNISALVHSLWYFVLSASGLIIGGLIRLIAVKIASRKHNRALRETL